MARHPLVPIIRLWLAFASLLALCFTWPELAMGIAPMMLMTNCCGCCTIYADTFATDTIATAWTSVSGTFTVGSGVASTTDASALMVANTESGAAATAVYCGVTITCATSSDKGRVILAYVDSDNYWYAEIQPGASNGTLKLFQRSSGSDTQRGSTATVVGYTSGAKTVCFEIIPGNVLVTTATVAVSYAATVAVASTQAGVGTGSGSSSVTYDNFTYSKHTYEDAACVSCNSFCTNCDSGTCHKEVQVTVIGIANSACALCTNLNATWSVTSTCASGTCTWAGTVFGSSPPGCFAELVSTSSLGLVIDGADVNLEFRLVAFGTGATVLLSAVYADSDEVPSDCQFSSEALAYESESSTSGACTYTGASATVTAV